MGWHWRISFFTSPALASPVCPSSKLTASSRLTSLYNFLWIRVTMPPFPSRTGVAMACGHCPGLLLYPWWFPYPAHTFPKESPFLNALQIIQFESAIFFLLRPQRTKIIYLFQTPHFDRGQNLGSDLPKVTQLQEAR